MDQEVILTQVSAETFNLNVQMLESIELENIVQIEYNQNSLKSNFQVLVEYLRNVGNLVVSLKTKQQASEQQTENLQKRVAKLEKENVEQQKEIGGLQDQNTHQQKELDHHTVEIENLKKQIQNLKEQIEHLNEKISQLAGRDNGAQDYDKLKKQIDLLWREVEALKLFKPSSNAGGSSNSNVDQEALMKLFQEIQDIKEKYVLKEEHEVDVNRLQAEIDALKKRVTANTQHIDENKNQIGEHSNQIADIYSKLKDCNLSIETKLATHIFNQEIENLKKLIKGLSGGAPQSSPKGQVEIVQQGLSEDDLKKIQNLEKAFKDLQDQITKLRQDVDSNQNQYSKNKILTDKRLDELERLIKQLAAQTQVDQLVGWFKQLRDDIDKLDSTSQEHEKKIKEILRIIEWLRDQKGHDGEKSGGGSMDPSLLDEKLRRLKDDLMQLLKAMREELDKKVTFDDLWKSEALILEKLDEVAGALLKKLADKGDTKKALIYLEKKINQLYALITKEGGKKGDLDSLISKRPLFWSCLSCDKNLDDYQGKLGDYKNWAMFPPKETSPERMGRFGKGYSQMVERQRAKDERFKQEQFASTDNLPQLKSSNGFQTQGHQFEKKL